MVEIGYHASHEQFHPRDLLRHAQAAEAAGFRGVMCSDHFHPWTPRQGHSGFAWAWLGAAMQATRSTFGVVTPPMGWRYPPAVTAQAVGTLASMYPDRFWAAFGTGEALNEHVVGERWPSKEERRARLKEAVDLVRRLLAGETVTHRGLVTVDRARVYTRPERAPLLLAAAITPETAEWAAGWADGLITVNQPEPALERTVAAFRRGGGGGKPLFLQAHLSWAETEEEALRNAHEAWRACVFPGPVSENVATPEEFEEVARHVRPEDVRSYVHVAADPEAHARWFERLAGMGFERVFAHNVGPNQAEFVEVFGTRVLPAVHEGEPVSLPGPPARATASSPPRRRG